MLRTLRADNFKCLDGFELELDGHALLMGLNGSGKSTVIELLDRLRRLWVRGDKASECFPGSTRTRWGSARPQAFELELVTGGHPLQLRVELGAPDERHGVRIVEEEISGAGVSVRRQGESSVVSGSDGIRQVLVPGEFSALPLLLGRGAENPGALHAINDAASLFPFRIEPVAMETLARTPSAELGFDGRNFACWLLMARRVPERLAAIERRATEVLNGFERFEFVPEGEQFRLTTLWRPAGSPAGGPGGATQRYDLGELSDGQRLILVLSALVERAGQGDIVLILDEPDNYVALQEIQPLLLSLMDIPTVQLIVVSHHPEIIDLMAKEYGYVLAREGDLGPVRVKRWQAPAGTMLPASALVARGDIDGGG